MKVRYGIRPGLGIFLAMLLVLAALTADSQGAPLPQLRVVGNEIVNAQGQRVVLRGVVRSGTEYECVQRRGIFAGPADPASIIAIHRWDANAVRIPLNEACWNGESYVNQAYAGGNYRSAVETYVDQLTASGMAVILDLHWSDGAYAGHSSGCSTAAALCQKPMPDAAQSVPFWTSVAHAFKDNDDVLFDLFNEPFPDKALSSQAAAWKCWRDGGRSCVPGISYPVAGMQALVSAVRATGASNIIMLGGLAFSNDLSRWLAYKPHDPDHNLVASWHSYNFNRCSTMSCWTSQIAPVIAKVPVVAGEIGENDCGGGYVGPLMDWLDTVSTGYLAWSWNITTGCSAGNTSRLIMDYSGTPTAFGAVVESHLQALAGS